MRRIAFILAVIIVLVGCIPVRHFNKYSSRTRGEIREQDVAFLEPGETSLEEILLRIGEPDYISDSGKILLYYWRISETYIDPIAVFVFQGGFDHDPAIIMVLYLDEDNNYVSSAYTGVYSGTGYHLVKDILAGNTASLLKYRK